MSESVVYRVQADDGRGPFRPGFSKYWADPDRPRPCPWYEEISPQVLFAQTARSERLGSACESREQLREWFSDDELRVLQSIGYRIVEFVPQRVVARLKSSQLIVVLP